MFFAVLRFRIFQDFKRGCIVLADSFYIIEYWYCIEGQILFMLRLLLRYRGRVLIYWLISVSFAAIWTDMPRKARIDLCQRSFSEDACSGCLAPYHSSRNRTPENLLGRWRSWCLFKAAGAGVDWDANRLFCMGFDPQSSAALHAKGKFIQKHAVDRQHL